MFNIGFLNEYFKNKILDKQDIICLHTIKWFEYIIFLVQPRNNWNMSGFEFRECWGLFVC